MNKCMKKICNGLIIPYLKKHSKIIRFMKVNLLLILITTLNASAVLYSQNSKLNLSLNDKSLIDVFRTIEQQSNYRFFFSDNYQDLSNPVSINVQEGDINNILTDLFKDKAITYKVLENDIIVITPSESQMQQLSVSGKVTDAMSNEPLIGATIIVEGTTSGVTTDLDGNYSINVPDKNAVLVFSYLGYLSEKITVGDQSAIDVKLAPDINKLDEVVVVGYGTMKKLDVSGSIVSADEQTLKEVPSANVSQALQGRMAGIEMSQTSTRPGSDMQIRIRGERSVYADNDPLIVVDGVPFAGSLNDIAPSDIKSIDILKDASATAIYGSRGANGVILVTTSRGMKNGAPSISYNGYYGIKSVAKKYEIYNGEEFQAFRHATLAASYHDQYTALEQASIAAGTSTDWQDLMYDNARVTNHDISVSTGTEKGAFSFGGGFYNETAVLPGMEYTRYSIRTTIDQEIGKLIKVGLSSQNSYGITDGESAGLMNNILTISPLAPAYNDDGSIRIQPLIGAIDDSYRNPLLLNNSELWQERRKRFATFNSLYGELKFTENLRYRVNLGLSYSKEDYGHFYGSDTPFQNGSTSASRVQGNNTTSWTIENLLYYDKVFAEKHRVNVTAMYSAEQKEYNLFTADATDLNADYLFYYNLALSNGDRTIPFRDNFNQPLQDYYQRGLMSYMGRVQYAYDDRYMLTATFRADGSSVLAPGHKWHNYPAFSAGWNINRESFLKDVNAISQLKLRVGYGQTSNQAIDPYATLGELTQVPYNYGDNQVYGFYANVLPNSNLGWEFTKNYNAGLEFGFLNSRITGYFDFYYQKTEDVLVQVQLPYSSGVSGFFWQNVGSTENKGLEFSTSAQIIKSSSGFGWDVDFNIYLNRNELVALNSGVTEDVGNRLFVGHPINSIYDYVRLGIIQEDEAPYCNFPAGRIKVQDIGGAEDGGPDGSITPDADRRVIGSFQPDFAGGLSTRLYYKNFDLSIVSFFKSGGTLISLMHQPVSYLNTNNARRNSLKLDYWTPEHPTGTYPQPGNQSGDDVNDFGSTLGYFNASFWKFRTITLGYTFDSKLLSHVGGKDARVYFTCQNPFTLFSPYMDAGGLDPEPTGYGSQTTYADLAQNNGIPTRQLTIGANVPPTRNFVFGLNVKF